MLNIFLKMHFPDIIAVAQQSSNLNLQTTTALLYSDTA